MRGGSLIFAEAEEQKGLRVDYIGWITAVTLAVRCTESEVEITTLFSEALHCTNRADLILRPK